MSPKCSDWTRRLDEAVAATPGAVLVGHSLACTLVAQWARNGPSTRVRGALLVAPSDPEAPAYPLGPTGFTPLPLGRLPFPSIVVASTDDPYVSLERALQFARAWGSRFVDIGAAGHINGQSSLGDWPEGFGLLQQLRATSDIPGGPAGE